MRRLICSAAILGAAGPAFAGGMVLPWRSVREVSRGGAFVAGSEDVDSLWLNPAGLAHQIGGTTLQAGAMYVNQDVDYTRIDSGDNTMPTVSSDYPGIPVPALAAAFTINDKLIIGGGTSTPYAGLHRYDVDGTQRYGSISIAETLIAAVTFGAAYKVSPRFRIGATVQNMVTDLHVRVIVSGCPGQTVCAPEDPEFDADLAIQQRDLWAPTASIGAQVELLEVDGDYPKLTAGGMFQLPWSISGATGTLKTRLPSSGFYEGATVVGDEASLAWDNPGVLRFGVELRPDERLRIEAALHAEFWGTHDEVSLTPKNVRLENVAGVGTYMIGPQAIPRHFKTSWAPSVGGEYRIGPASVGAGYSYETSAAPKAYVSVLTVDSGKHMIGAGGAYHGRSWTLGASLGFVKLSDVNVALDEAKVPQQTPVRGQPSEVYINAGEYKSYYLLAGLEFSKRL